MMSRTNQVVTGLVAGAAVGAAVGLLFAPKPGKVTRRFVAIRAARMRWKTGGYVVALRQRMRKDAGEP